MRSLRLRPPFVFLAWPALACLALACLPGPLRAQRLWSPANVPLAHYAAPIAPWPSPSYRAKDFALVRVGPVYHLFYTRLQRYVPRHAGLGASEVLNETGFGHAVSRDLEHWTDLDTVLAVNADSFERHHVWAPTIVQSNGVWWMFYTGVTDIVQAGTTSNWIPYTQLVCAAWTTDPRLSRWTRLPVPVWGPCASNGLPGVPWALCSPTLPGGTADFRDPFVLPPPAGAPAGSPWLLWYTARPRTDEYNYVIGVATSGQGPGNAWSDGGALWDVYAPALNSKLESPHVFQHGGMWNLFVSGDDGTNGILRYTALMPATGPWESAGSILPRLTGQPDLPYPFTLDPAYWFASEYYGEDGPIERADYFCFVHTYDVDASLNPPNTPSDQAEPITDVEFRRMLWNPDGTFGLSTPNPVRSLWLSRAVATIGDTVRITLQVEGGARQRADFAVALETPTGEQALSPVNLGLPVSAPLADGSVTVNWAVRPSGFALPATVVVRMANQPLKLDQTIVLQPIDGGTDPGLPQMPIVRARIPGPAGGIESPPGGAGSGTAGGSTDPGTGTPGAPPPPRLPGGTGAAAPAALELRQVGSMPGQGGIGLLVGLPEAGTARLDVFDVAGRHVRSLGGGELPRGYTLESWDGRDAQGRAARRGIYFVRLATARERATLRLLLID